MDKLVLIDGNSLINRAFYATPLLTTKDGTPTNAVYAFINMLLKIINEIKPTHILVAFDRKEPTFRHKLYKEYKGLRKPMPEELFRQLSLLKRVLDEMGIARYEMPGIEADDIIGTMAKRFDVNTIIITGDKDSFQLVDDTTSVYFTIKGISEYDVYSGENFIQKLGFPPSGIIELKSMMGDKSDNIPGIEGVGEKTALSLIAAYGTIENLYEHTDELKGKLKEKVIASRETAFLSKTLATINTSVDIPLDLDDMKYNYPFGENVKRLFSELELKKLVLKDEIFSRSDNIGTDVDNNDKKEEKQLPKKIEIISAEQILSFVKTSKISFIIDKNIYFYDMEYEYEIKIKDNFFDDGLMYDEALKLLKVMFEKDDISLVLYGKKDLMHELDKYDIRILAKSDDVSIQNYVLGQSGNETFKEALISSGKDVDHPAFALFELYEEYDKRLKDEGMSSLYEDIELPLVDVLYNMEHNGFKIDVNSLNDMAVEYGKKVEELLNNIIQIAGENFNPNSPKQLGVILFEKLGLKAGKKTKNGYSTGAEVLESLENEHEIIPLILKYRQIQKLYSTYIEGFKPLIDRKTGLVHTSFLQTMTTTGRLSSREPNLQNIPVREAEGKEIRKLFISSFDGGKIVGADYSQIELRLLAHFSGCEPLIDAFNTGKDIHSLTASQVFGVPLNMVNSEMRRSAKAVNFGIIYGISDFGLAKQLKISPKRAGEYIKKYFEMYPSVKEYMDDNVKFAKEHGYVCTLLGRRRYIREINAANYNLRSFGERAAMNMPLQGTAADIIKLAMIKVYERIKRENIKSKLILQVHDELIIDTHPDEVDIVKEILLDEMNDVIKLKVPLIAETECGDRWFDAK